MAKPITDYLPDGPSDCLTVAQTAAFLRVSTETVRKMIKEGRIVGVRTAPVRGRVRIPKKALAEFLEKCRM